MPPFAPTRSSGRVLKHRHLSANWRDASWPAKLGSLNGGNPLPELEQTKLCRLYSLGMRGSTSTSFKNCVSTPCGRQIRISSSVAKKEPIPSYHMPTSTLLSRLQRSPTTTMKTKKKSTRRSRPTPPPILLPILLPTLMLLLLILPVPALLPK